MLVRRSVELRHRTTPPPAFRVTGIRRAAWLSLLGSLLLAGCASVLKDYPRTYSTALQDHSGAAIVDYLARSAAHHPWKSGFALTHARRQAFADRVALTELAEKTLDLQYYVWVSDATGRILAERLAQAADRGVRVRILLDDIGVKGRDAVLAALGAHPNIEIRMFNPFAHRGARGLDYVTDFGRVNHRMHNTLMAMDNAVAIVGGREISDH